MATPTGLVVPNVKNVQALSLLQIASELTRLTDLARGGTVPPSDLTGGTFSLSNIGAIGGTYASPIVLPGELAIGALGRLRVVPRLLVLATIFKNCIFDAFTIRRTHHYTGMTLQCNFSQQRSWR